MQSLDAGGLSSLQWRHNGHDGVSNHQPHDCLLNLLFRRRSKKTSKLRVTGLCAGNSPVTGEFPAQRVSNAENASIRWRHHDCSENELFSISFSTISPVQQFSLYYHSNNPKHFTHSNTVKPIIYPNKSLPSYHSVPDVSLVLTISRISNLDLNRSTTTSGILSASLPIMLHLASM